jgi:hypothetical protein
MLAAAPSVLIRVHPWSNQTALTRHRGWKAGAVNPSG